MPDDDVHVNMLFHLSLPEALIIIGLQLLKLEFDTAEIHCSFSPVDAVMGHCCSDKLETKW